MTMRDMPDSTAALDAQLEAMPSARPGRYRPSRAMRLMLRLAPSLRLGTLNIVLPDGSLHRFQGGEPGPEGTLIVHNDRLARRMFTGGTLGFCEAYLDGDWSSPNAPPLFELAIRNEDALARVLDGQRWMHVLSWIAHAVRPNTKRGSRKNIAFHYDLGNAFYGTWLDRSMTYSAALWRDRAESLEQAQHNKYSRMCEEIGLAPGRSVLEIGCGWGGFAETAARDFGARVTAITISREQHDFAKRRIFEAGLAERVDIRMQDYRDTDGVFDAVASCEMFEAVGEAYWPTYFRTVRERLADRGRACLQVITIADRYFDVYRRKADYIQKYIFPGGMLPSPTALRGQANAAGLSVANEHSFGPDYARTLSLWNDRFQDAWPQIAGMGFDTRFKRMWEQYLWYCEAGFKVGWIDVVQSTLIRA